MNLTYFDWSLVLDLNGGRIQKLTHKGKKVFGTYNRIDGKTGNTYVCAPSFDKEGQEKYGLPFHGYARTLQWQKEHQTANTMIISTTTPSSPTYLAQLKITQTFLLDNQFSHMVSLSHVAGISVPVNVGIHYYWDTPNGWDDIQMNNVNIQSNIKTNGYVNLEKTNTIVFPHATYELTSNGFHSAVLWTSFKTDTAGNKIYNDDFCCIEPIIGWPDYFGSDKSILRRGETKTVSIVLGAGERT